MLFLSKHSTLRLFTFSGLRKDGLFFFPSRVWRVSNLYSAHVAALVPPSFYILLLSSCWTLRLLTLIFLLALSLWFGWGLFLKFSLGAMILQTSWDARVFLLQEEHGHQKAKRHSRETIPSGNRTNCFSITNSSWVVQKYQTWLKYRWAAKKKWQLICWGEEEGHLFLLKCSGFICFLRGKHHCQ